MNVIQTLLGLLAPRLIETLTSAGVERSVASSAVKSASAKVAQEHEGVQDKRLKTLEDRLDTLEKLLADSAK